jgi:hypothetical protein
MSYAEARSQFEKGRSVTPLLRLHEVGLWIGVDKMLAPFRETVKI